jgi:DNA polymerase elongation subunit (family B)
LFDCKDSAEVISKGYENALLLLTKTIDKLMTGDIQLQGLLVSKLLGQGLDKYKSLFPHVSAAIQLANEGKSTMVGEGVEYIYTNARHSNPFCRVTPKEFIKEGQEFDYDKEKYMEVLLEAADTVLRYFGFDRTVYGDAPKKKNRKWWADLNDDRLKDIDTERVYLES